MKNTGTGTIYDNESIPKISVAAAARTEGDSGTDTAAFTVNVSHVSAQDIYVDYSTLNGSAEAGKDYIAAAGTLKIPAGHTSGVINVSINGDTVHEDDEYFSLVLANPEGAEIDPSGGSAVCVIFDNDPAPSVAFGQSEVTADEGDSGTTPMVFTVMLAEESEKTISIDYETEDGTAETADNDYTSMSGTLVFAPGETSKSITVNINGDTAAEDDENFFVVLKPITGDIKAEGVITDDDNAFIKMLKVQDGSEIANGDTVGFENTKAGEESELELTISNTGNADLAEDGANKLVSITGTDFIIRNEPVSPVAGKSSAAFTIVFKPSSAGVKTAEVTIYGNGAKNSPFVFMVSGTGTSDSSAGVGTSGGTAPETPLPKETIDISVGDYSLKNVSVDVHYENSTKTTTKTTTVNLDETEVRKTLDEMEKTEPGKKKKVIIPVANDSDRVVGELMASTLKAMADMNTVLEIKTENAVYSLPANVIDLDEVVKQFGGNPELNDILVKVTVTRVSDDKSEEMKSEADGNGFEIMADPVEFEISFTYAGKEVVVSSFSSYVTRTVAIPEGVDPDKITTGVVYYPDGSFIHVPTSVYAIGNRYFANMNSLTNSTYALIYNPLTFKDVENHWAKDYIYDAGSRLIISGTGNGYFMPDKAVTRAEFAAMIVKALGLKGSGFADNNFPDVGKDDPYYSYICTAYQYGIIKGYTDGRFGPDDLITREQSMLMITRAMKIAGMDITLVNTDILSKNSSDSGDVSNWAIDGAAVCVDNGLFIGSNGKLEPKNNVTRAESAAAVIKLLKNAGLI